MLATPKKRNKFRNNKERGQDGTTGRDSDAPLDAHSRGLHGILHCSRTAADREGRQDAPALGQDLLLGNGGSGITAMVLALWLPILFLAFVAIFSFYFAFRGYRVLSRKLPLKGQGPRAIDWAAAVLAFLGSAALIVLGIVRPSRVWVQLSAVAIVFGVIGVAFAASDVWQFIHPPADKNFWLYAHLGGMIGSYIAAVSAFSVVNFHFLPRAVRWLWPSAIGVPGIFIWVGYYKRKFGRSGKLTKPAQ